MPSNRNQINDIFYLIVHLSLIIRFVCRNTLLALFYIFFFLNFSSQVICTIKIEKKKQKANYSLLNPLYSYPKQNQWKLKQILNYFMFFSISSIFLRIVSCMLSDVCINRLSSKVLLHILFSNLWTTYTHTSVRISICWCVCMCYWFIQVMKPILLHLVHKNEILSY